MRFVGAVAGVLILAVFHLPPGPYPGDNVIATAAASGNAGGQGVSGQPQKNGTIKGSPKPNPSINGSQSRAKH